MIVVYNEDFLERLRRPNNIVTIGSFSAVNIASSSVNKDNFSKFVLEANGKEVVAGENMIGFLDHEKQVLKLRLDFPDTFPVNISKSEFNTVRFYSSEGDTLFAIVNNTQLEKLNNVLHQTRNLFNLRFPDEVLGNIKTGTENKDLNFLTSYGVDLGENLFKIDEDGNVMMTRDSFYKVFTLDSSVMDVEEVSYTRNDVPYLNYLGEKKTTDYTYRIYKNVKIFCPGLEFRSSYPTKYNLYRNYYDGGITIYGTADYDEYRVFGNSPCRISSGTDTIDHIVGIEFQEVKNNGLKYRVDYGKQKLIYTRPDEPESTVNMNANVILKAVIRNYTGSIIESEPIRFYQGGKEDEWKITYLPTTYKEGDIPVFIFPYNAGEYYTTKKSKMKDRYSKEIKIETILKINKPDQIKVTFENSLLGKYFEVECSKIKKYYEDSDTSIFKKTEIYITLRPKKVNNELIKWYPLGKSGKSELMLATVSYGEYSTSFYMVQSPKVKGLKLYEFNPVGANFSQVQNIEFSSIEQEKVYWMLTEEMTIPGKNGQCEWLASRIGEGSINESLGISVSGEEYKSKTAFIDKDEKNTVRTEGYGLFSGISPLAKRADVETGTNTSSFIMKADDEELLQNRKYLAILDEFSIDANGYITLGTSKVVSQSGATQYSTISGNLVSKIGTAFGDLKNVPVTKSVTTYIKNTGTKSLPINSAIDANVSTDKSYIQANEVPKFIATTTTTDSRLIDNDIKLDTTASKYWVTDSKVIGQFVDDSKTREATDVIGSVGMSLLDNKFASANYTDIREKQNVVLTFIAADGTIKTTSKEDGISVKVVTDDEGKLIRDPRKIWDNKKLRPVIIRFKKNPVDVNELRGEPLTFFRVSDEERKNLELNYDLDYWRNVVTRAAVSYEILKKGQEPFIQIIEKLKNDDVKSWRYINGRFERYILRGSSSRIDTTYINRKSIIVRSNCPFKLAFKYNSGFNGTLAFDNTTVHMQSYTKSNDLQTLYSKSYDSKYGKGIYINVLEADNTGEIAKIIATYNDYSTETSIVANEFKSYDTATLVDKDGNIDKNELSKLVIIDRGIAKNIYASSKRTLHNMFTSFTDVEDVEKLYTVDTKDDVRAPLNYNTASRHLRVSSANPYFDSQSGYKHHKITLDVERTKGSPSVFPINPIGQLSVLPYNKKHIYSRNSTNGVQYYLYENGQAPKITVTSQPGMLGGTVPTEQTDPEILSATINGQKYNLSKWKDNEVENRLKGIADNRIPVRWLGNNATYYTLPGASYDDTNKVISYTEPNTVGLSDSLYREIYVNAIWTKLDQSNLSKAPNFTSRTPSYQVIDTNKPFITGDQYIESTGSDTLKAITSSIYKVSRKYEYWKESSNQDITYKNATFRVKVNSDGSSNQQHIQELNTLMPSIGDTAVFYFYPGEYIVVKRFERVQESANSFPRTVTNLISGRVRMTGTLKLTRHTATSTFDYFSDPEGNIYVKSNNRSIRLTFNYVYVPTSIYLGDIGYATGEDGIDSRTTFTVQTNYPLQYVKTEEGIGYINPIYNEPADYVEYTSDTVEINNVTYQKWRYYANNQGKLSDGTVSYCCFNLTEGPVADQSGIYTADYMIFDGDVPYSDGIKQFKEEVYDDKGKLIKLYELGASASSTHTHRVTDSPTKLYKIGQEVLDVINQPSITEAEILKEPDRQKRGKLYSKMLDIDIHTSGSGFKIDSIVGNKTVLGGYEYTFTVSPTEAYNSSGSILRGQIIIDSRVRQILNTNTQNLVPSGLINLCPRILPLYTSNGSQVSGETRPPFGLTWDTSQVETIKPAEETTTTSDEYNYELTILPEMRKKIDAIVPPDQVVINIYQQKNSLIQLVGDRSQQMHNGEVRRYSTQYNPGVKYQIGNGDTNVKSVTLGKDTIRLKCFDSGWVGKDKLDDGQLPNGRLGSIYDLKELVADQTTIEIGSIYEVYMFTSFDNRPGETQRSFYFKYRNDGSWERILNVSGLTITGRVPAGTINLGEWTSDEAAEEKALGIAQKTLSLKVHNLRPGDIYYVEDSLTDSNISKYYEYKPLNYSNKIQIIVDNYNPNQTNKSGQPYSLVSYTNLFSSYYPTKLNPGNMQDGKIVAPEFKQGSTRDSLIDFGIDLGVWRLTSGSGSVDGRDYFSRKKDDSEIVEILGVGYQRWYKYENGKEYDGYCLLLPEGIDTLDGAEVDNKKIRLTYSETNATEFTVNGISLDNPLPVQYYFTLTKDNDTSGNYFTDVKGKLLVKYTEGEPGKLYGTAGSNSLATWTTLAKNVYEETISLRQPGIDKCLVCAAPGSRPRYYISDTSKNTINVQVSSDQTSLELLAGVFSLTGKKDDKTGLIDNPYYKSSDSVISLPTLAEADRNDWYMRRYEDSGKTIESIKEINGIKYSVWDRYGELGKYKDDSIYIDKKYDDVVGLDGKSVKRMSLLNVEKQNSSLKVIYPSYSSGVGGNLVEGGEPLVDYEATEIDGKITDEKLYPARRIAYHKYIQVANETTNSSNYILFNSETSNLGKITQEYPRTADYTYVNDILSTDEEVTIARYDWSKDNFIEVSEDTMNVGGKEYRIWYEYEFKTDNSMLPERTGTYYLFPSSGPALPEGSTLYFPEYTGTIGGGDIENNESAYFQRAFTDINNKVYKIYVEGAVASEHLYQINSDTTFATGETKLNVTSEDKTLKDWSYDVIGDTCKVDFEGNYTNNLRINFPYNSLEQDVTRPFKIESGEDQGIRHVVYLNITQSSSLGNVYCNNTANFNSYGSFVGQYIDGDVRNGVDNYFYFDTDIPGSELEFLVKEDPSASVILSAGEDTNSTYGISFKRYRLNIKLGNNLTRETKTKTLTITRYYSVYDDKTGTLTRKFKIMKTVKLIQGYRALYISNPAYLQANINKTADANDPIPEYLSSGGIIGSFNDPLLVPASRSTYAETIIVDDVEKTMNYTAALYFEKYEPSLESGGSFVLEKYSQEKLLKSLGSKPITGQTWNIVSPETIPSVVYSNYEVKVIQKQTSSLVTPCLYHEYTTNSNFENTNVISFVEVTLAFNDDKYSFYAYMQKKS